jgi:hypothetical protein
MIADIDPAGSRVDVLIEKLRADLTKRCDYMSYGDQTAYILGYMVSMLQREVRSNPNTLENIEWHIEAADRRIASETF